MSKDNTKDYSVEDRRVLDQYERMRERQKEKHEAAEEMLKRATKNALSNTRVKQGVAQDLLKKWEGKERPDDRLINFLRHGNDGLNTLDYEPDPTGFEQDRYWEDED